MHSTAVSEGLDKLTMRTFSEALGSIRCLTWPRLLQSLADYTTHISCVMFHDLNHQAMATPEAVTNYLIITITNATVIITASIKLHTNSKESYVQTFFL